MTDRLAWLFHEAPERTALRVFVAVAEEGSFTRAADRLFLTQPWLSTQVRTLEARLGLRLFERSSHHVERTPAAERLLPLARDLLDAVDASLVAAAAATAPAAAGVLRLGAPSYTLRMHRRVEAVERFRVALPDARITIDNDPTVALASRLRRGELDMAFLLAPVDTQGLAALAFERLTTVLQIPAGHALAAAGEIRLDDLRGQRVATWRAELHRDHWEESFGRFRDHGAILVPLSGLILEGLAEAAARLDLICVTNAEAPHPPGTVVRPLVGGWTSLIVLAAPADRAAWSAETTAFWTIAESLRG